MRLPAGTAIRTLPAASCGCCSSGRSRARVMRAFVAGCDAAALARQLPTFPDETSLAVLDALHLPTENCHRHDNRRRMSDRSIEIRRRGATPLHRAARGSAPLRAGFDGRVRRRRRIDAPRQRGRRRWARPTQTCLRTRARCRAIRSRDESYGTRSQFETEVRTRYKTATPQSSWTFTPLRERHGHRHAVGPAFRAQPRRHRGHRSREALAVRARPGARSRRSSRCATCGASRRCRACMFLECSGNGLTEWSKPTLHDRAGHARPHVDVGMDRRAARDDPERGRRALRARSGCSPKAATPPR